MNNMETRNTWNSKIVIADLNRWGYFVLCDDADIAETVKDEISDEGGAPVVVDENTYLNEEETGDFFVYENHFDIYRYWSDCWKVASA